MALMWEKFQVKGPKKQAIIKLVNAAKIFKIITN